jgi:hypothetical protein
MPWLQIIGVRAVVTPSSPVREQDDPACTVPIDDPVVGLGVGAGTGTFWVVARGAGGGAGAGTRGAGRPSTVAVTAGRAVDVLVRPPDPDIDLLISTVACRRTEQEATLPVGPSTGPGTTSGMGGGDTHGRGSDQYDTGRTTWALVSHRGPAGIEFLESLIVLFRPG